MDIFRYRPLFLWCTAFTAASAGGFLLFGVKAGMVNGISAGLLLGLVLACLFLAGVGVCVALTLTHRRRQAVTLVLAVIVSALGLWQSYATFAGAQTRRLASLEGETVTATGVITERRSGEGQLSGFSLELSHVNGVPTDGMAVLNCYYNADLHAGDVVEICATAISLEESAGDGYSAIALLGDGYVFAIQSANTFGNSHQKTFSARAAVHWSTACILRWTSGCRDFLPLSCWVIELHFLMPCKGILPVQGLRTFWPSAACI